MTFWKEFQKFAVKGNMVDLAIGVVIGAAFNSIVDAIVKQILTPTLGLLTSGIDLANLKWILRPAVLNADGSVAEPALAVGYGLLIQALIDFFIVAMTLFLVIRAINVLRDQAEDEQNEVIPTPKDIKLLSEIRDGINRLNTGGGA